MSSRLDVSTAYRCCPKVNDLKRSVTTCDSRKTFHGRDALARCRCAFFDGHRLTDVKGRWLQADCDDLHITVSQVARPEFYVDSTLVQTSALFWPRFWEQSLPDLNFSITFDLCLLPQVPENTEANAPS